MTSQKFLTLLLENAALWSILFEIEKKSKEEYFFSFHPKLNGRQITTSTKYLRMTNVPAMRTWSLIG